MEMMEHDYLKEVKYRPTKAEDRDFLYQLHVLTMKEYVDKTWGWDDAFQEAVFKKDFDPDEQKIITFDNQDIGVISVKHNENEVFLRTIEIHPDFQRRGIGTFIIESLLNVGLQVNKPVMLHVLKVNPAKKLYERLGFKAVTETPTHFVMKRRPPRWPNPGLG